MNSGGGRRVRTGVSLLASLLTLVVAAGVGTLPASARTRQAQQGEALTLTLAKISPAAGPGSKAPLVFQLVVRDNGAGPLQGLRVDTLAGGPLRTHSEFQQVAGETAPSLAGFSLLDRWQVPGQPRVAPGAALTLPAHALSLPPRGDPAAVLPLVLRVSGDSASGPVSAQLLTFAVDLNGQVAAAQRLRIALLAPLHEPTQRTPAGAFIDQGRGLEAQLAPSAPLGAIAAALSRPGAPKVTLVVDALLTEEASLLVGNPGSKIASQFTDNLRAAADQNPQNPPSAFPYDTADLPSLLRGGYDTEALASVLRGQNLLREFGTTPSTALAWPVSGPIDTATLKGIALSGATTVVLPARLLPTSAALTQNATVNLGPGVAPLRRALVPDTTLSTPLSSAQMTTEPVAWAQRILAESAVTWLEQPNSSQPRGVLLAPPQSWRPSPAFFRALAQGLAAAGWLRLEPAAQLATDVPQGPDRQPRQLVPYGAADAHLGLPASYLASIAKTRASLASFNRAVGDNFALSDDFDRDLLIAASSDWRPSPARPRGASFINAVKKGMRTVYSKVGVDRTPRTLTSRTGQLPITVINDGDQPLEVMLQLSSPRVDLPAATQPFLLAAHRRVTKRIEVSTRTTGSFPILVEVLTPDGRQITQASVTLVSTAFDRVALLLAGGAAAFLLVWWGRKRARRRGGDAGAGAAPATPSSPGASTSASTGAPVDGVVKAGTP